MSLLDLIPVQFRLAAAAAGALAMLMGGAAAGWTANGWRLNAEHDRQAAQDARVASQAFAEQQHARQQLEQQLAGIDQQHYQELTHAQENTDRLSADLAAAHQRLRVRVAAGSCSAGSVPASTGAAGVDDGAGTRADLYPATAAGVVRVTGRADECRARLTALQAWARAVTGGGG